MTLISPNIWRRYEPIGDDLEGSSITVPVGVEEVPGLAEALSEWLSISDRLRNFNPCLKKCFRTLSCLNLF